MAAKWTYMFHHHIQYSQVDLGHAGHFLTRQEEGWPCWEMSRRPFILDKIYFIRVGLGYLSRAKWCRFCPWCIASEPHNSCQRSLSLCLSNFPALFFPILCYDCSAKWGKITREIRPSAESSRRRRLFSTMICGLRTDVPFTKWCRAASSKSCTSWCDTLGVWLVGLCRPHISRLIS